MTTSPIFGPDQSDPILSEVASYAYAIAKLHARIEEASAPPTFEWETCFAEAEFRYYIRWALSTYANLRAYAPRPAKSTPLLNATFGCDPEGGL